MGRLQLGSATGVETQPLTLSLRSEYWQGSGFIENTDDTCTAGLLGGTAHIIKGTITNATGTIPVTTTATAVNVNGTGTLTGLAIGPAPGQGNTGSIEFFIDLGSASANLPYLRDKKNNTDDDSNANDVYDDNPAAQAIFRSVGGGTKERNFIFMRESR